MRVFATCKILNAHLLTSIWWRMRNEKENISLILLPNFWQKHRIKMWRPNFPKFRWGLWWCFLFCLSVQLWSSVQARRQNLVTLLDSFRIQAFWGPLPSRSGLGWVWQSLSAHSEMNSVSPCSNQLRSEVVHVPKLQDSYNTFPRSHAEQRVALK